MTIAENIAFGLKISKKSKEYINDKIKYALKLVNLDGFEKRSVDSLSGGQQQRIAIARAVFSEHPILMLDEATSALDEATAQQLLENLRHMTDKTVLMVTHRADQTEFFDKRQI